VDQDAGARALMDGRQVCPARRTVIGWEVMVRQHSAVSEVLVDEGIGGGVGTVAMSLVMLGARRAGLVGELPPTRMAAALLDAVSVRGGPGWVRNALAVVLHLGFGAAAGEFFALLRGRLRLPVAPAVQGMAYGVVVWWVSYMGWVPAVGLLPAATRDEPRRPVVMVCAHGVYGAVLGALVGYRSRRGGAPPPR